MNLRNLPGRFVKKFYSIMVARELKENITSRPCPLCGNLEFENIKSGDRYNLPIVTVKCSCGLIMTNPMPTSEYLQKFYSSNRYRGLYIGSTIVKDLGYDNAEKKLKSNLDFFQSKGFQDLVPFNLQEATVLDFGSAVGAFLRGFKSVYSNAKIYGIEPGAHISQVSKNALDGQFSSISEVPAGLKFNLITSWHVIEHLWNPIEDLSRLSQLLEPNGLLVFEVPDYHRYNSLKNYHIAHLYHFDEKTITNVLKSSGFEVLQVTREHLVDPSYGMKVVARRISQDSQVS